MAYCLDILYYTAKSFMEYQLSNSSDILVSI